MMLYVPERLRFSKVGDYIHIEIFQKFENVFFTIIKLKIMN